MSDRTKKSNTLNRIKVDHYIVLTQKRDGELIGFSWPHTSLLDAKTTIKNLINKKEWHSRILRVVEIKK